MSPKQFVGMKEVMLVAETADKTPMGGDIISVSYADGSKEILTKKIFEAIVTPEAVDATELRRLRVSPIVKEMLVLLRESNIKMGEVEFMIALLVESVNQNADQASNKLWGIKEGGDRTFLQIDKILSDESGQTK